MNIPGYLLILAKECRRGMGDIPHGQHQELKEVTAATRKVLSEVYNLPTLVFEHGPRIGKYRGGGCLDHAHFHAVPGADIIDALAYDLWKRLDTTNFFHRVDRVEGYDRLAEILTEEKSSYLYVEDVAGRRHVVEVNFHIPSQYMRQLISLSSNVPTWDWALDPDYPTVEKTIDALTRKF